MNNPTMDIDEKTAMMASSSHSSTSSMGHLLSADLPAEKLAAINQTMNSDATIMWKGFFISDTDWPDANWRRLLTVILIQLATQLQDTQLRDKIAETRQIEKIVEVFSGKELKECQELVQMCLDEEAWGRLINYPKIHINIPKTFRQAERNHNIQTLSQAFRVDYLGRAAIRFVEHLKDLDNQKHYAKFISIVQSSATGKSRMLAQVGKSIFLRSEDGAGYPVGDCAVYDFFIRFHDKEHSSITANHHIACFLAAAHQTMLKRLRTLISNQAMTGDELRAKWHQRMELDENRDYRKLFYAEVLHTEQELYNSVVKTSENSPKPDKLPPDFDPITNATKAYNHHARRATKALVEFLSNYSTDGIYVMYFDEAHNLGKSIWTMARLLSNQQKRLGMWYVVVGTKSQISYYAPQSCDLHSMRLQKEVSVLPSPFISLGFDQHMIHRPGSFSASTIADFQSIAHLCNYGRPIWKAQYNEGDQTFMDNVTSKLTCGREFNPKNMHDVFAVLSHRLCIDAILDRSEAQALAETSVENHMRLLTGVSPDKKIFSTCSPSEPILTLGACELLYSTPKSGPDSHWATVLDTFSQELCSSGLVDKGLLGELVARTLLVIARDFSTKKQILSRVPDLLQPVPLVDVIDTLFGKQIPDDAEFRRVFAAAHVNYTHWSITKDRLPEDPDLKFLLNMWARGAALQCCFNQQSLDCLIPIYFGDVNPTARFRPSRLSAIVLQVKYRIATDAKAEPAVKPIGIPRDSHNPLPYLAFLWELGAEVKNGDNFCLTSPDSTESVTFEDLAKKCKRAKEELEKYNHGKKRNRRDKRVVESLKLKIKETQKRMDDYKRYSLVVRGVSPKICKILKEAQIEGAFERFTNVTMPQGGTIDGRWIQHLRPVERLGEESAHLEWMWDMDEPSDDDAVMTDAEP